MINVHFVSQNMGIIRAKIAEAAKTMNVPSEILKKIHKKSNFTKIQKNQNGSLMFQMLETLNQITDARQQAFLTLLCHFAMQDSVTQNFAVDICLHWVSASG